MRWGTHSFLLLILCLIVFSAVYAPGWQVSSPGRQAPLSIARKQLTLGVDGDTVTILRDSFGVPHVFASTERGLFFGNGYAVAQDRLWQMERYRHDARGTLAELEGKPALARDRETRRTGYTAGELNALFQQLPPEERRIWEDYRDGVNAYIEQARADHRLPEGYAKLGIQPAPWDVLDTTAVGVMMARRFGSAGGQEVQNFRILGRLEGKFGAVEAHRIFDDLLWRNDPRSPVSIGNEDMADPSASGRSIHRPESEREMFDEEYADPILALGTPAPSETALQEAESRFEMRDVLEYAAAHQLPTKLGSYAIAIARSRSVSGNPLLVAGPQMGWMTPQIAHEIHLSGAGYDVVGMGFAGVPGVLIGHNANLAWTLTSGIDDLVDAYQEKLLPGGRYRYEFRGITREMDCRTEVIRVRGAQPERLEVCRTVHGPVMSWDEQAGTAYSLKAAYERHELGTFETLHALSRAKTVQEAAKAAESMWTSQNLIAADQAGNIGYWHCGRFPIRPAKYDPRLPLPGTGEAEWQGLERFSRNPQAINPVRGYVANWNNKPVPWFDNGDRPVWGEVFRAQRIRELVERQPKHTVDSLIAVLQDISSYDTTSDVFRPYLLKAVEQPAAGNSELKQAAEYIRAWSGRADDESVGKAILDAWLARLERVLFQQEFADSISDRDLPSLVQPSFILHVLEGKQSGVPPQHDYLHGRSRDQLIVDALRLAISDLKRLSPQMYDWGYHARMNESFGPLAAVPQQNRGTYIQIDEVGPEIRALSILPPGQSEDAASPHYSDQLNLSSWWKFKPLVTDRAALEK